LDTLLATEIEFSTQSNFITAGGFGPNQVSALLGLGVLAVCILVFCFKRSRSFRYVFLAIGLWFLAQAVLTFSRGGVLNGLLPILAIVVYLLRSPEQRKTAFVTLLIGVLAFSSFLLPELDRFTQGVLQQRFGELDTSGRDVLVQADLQAFLDNPITGAGVGQSVLYHRFYLNKDVSSHTEYTRLFAEHGLLGIFSLLMLGILLSRNIRRNQDSPLVKTIVIALMMWALLYMSHSAMRTVAPSLMLGLTFARFVKEKPKP
jgi:O-antigen ligase